MFALFLVVLVAAASHVDSADSGLCPLPRHMVCNANVAKHACVCAMAESAENFAPAQSCNQVVDIDDDEFDAVEASFSLDDKAAKLTEFPEDRFREDIVRSLSKSITKDQIFIFRVGCSEDNESFLVQFGILKNAPSHKAAKIAVDDSGEENDDDEDDEEENADKKDEKDESTEVSRDETDDDDEDGQEDEKNDNSKDETEDDDDDHDEEADGEDDDEDEDESSEKPEQAKHKNTEGKNKNKKTVSDDKNENDKSNENNDDADEEEDGDDDDSDEDSLYDRSDFRDPKAYIRVLKGEAKIADMDVVFDKIEHLLSIEGVPNNSLLILQAALLGAFVVLTCVCGFFVACRKSSGYSDDLQKV